MGVWTTGRRAESMPCITRICESDTVKFCPDWHEEDVPGSPYAIADYEVPASFGWRSRAEGDFARRLNEHGLKLILDFVPNHMGLDHPWVESWPELLVHSAQASGDISRQETLRGTLWIAHGRDPFFPPWTDTVQLDYRNPATRTAMIQVLKSDRRSLRWRAVRHGDAVTQ